MVCEICGKNFEHKMYYGEYSNCCSGRCFTRKFWNNIMEEKDEHVIVDGTCYAIANTPTNGFCGFGGSRFKIKMFDAGEVIETNNLWCQGKIPEEYRDQFPDTAQFIV